MNRNDALKILELSSSASEEEIKKQFKKLAAKYHPDRNKDADAESKFKEINSAYAFLTEKHPEPQTNPFSDISDFFFRQQRNRNRKPFVAKPIEISLDLTFKESVKGCKKHISFKRFEECVQCEGLGGTPKDQCTDCRGRGVIPKTTQHGPGTTYTIMQPCTTCLGGGCKIDKCNVCAGIGAKQQEKSLDVMIPGGIQNGQTIRLAGQGNWHNVPTYSGYADAFITANVEIDPDMKLQGKDVISALEIDLLTALKGGARIVKTVDCDVEIKIPKGTKHRDRIYLTGHGVPAPGSEAGSHIVEISVQYPDNIDKLIEMMEANFSQN